MVKTDSTPRPYVTIARNERHAIQLDAPIPKGGGGEGFGAHELLEASLATCINMAVRMHADAHRIALQNVSCSVHLTKPDAETSRFEYSLQLAGDLTAEQRAALYAAASTCPVRQTLSRRLEFSAVEQP